MSILDKLGNIFWNFNILKGSHTIIEKPTKLQNYEEIEKKQKYKHLKYICNRCGAYNHRNQGYCGMCRSSHLRRAVDKEKDRTISFLENLF